ncbi:MAG: ComF family protein [Victivallales bacterium]|nr:ComF family protein [Victivallales bacterium]
MILNKSSFNFFSRKFTAVFFYCRNLTAKFLNIIFSHFFTYTCPLCKQNTIHSTELLCEECISELDFIAAPYCKSCGGSNDTIFEFCSQCLKEEKQTWDKAFSIFNMKNLSRDLIIKYKYYGDIALVKPLTKYCFQKIRESGIEFDIITYVPLHWIKYVKRGYNQSLLVSNFLSKETSIPCKKLLKRTKFTKSQTKLSNVQRRKNLKTVFKTVNIPAIKNQRILLVDDVYTTGSTLRACAKTLRKSGAKEISILTLARR